MKINFQIIFFIITILFIISLGHFVVYKAILVTFNINNIRLINLIRILLAFGTISFIFTNFVVQIGYTKKGSFFYEISAIWLGTIYFLFLASVIILIIASLNSFIGWPITYIHKVGYVLLFIAFCISIYGVINSYTIRVVEYNIPIRNLPEEWNNKKILMFSDSHFGNIRNYNFALKLVDKINYENPEMVIIAGDYFDGPPVDSERVTMTLKAINAKKGVYFAPGNHEDYGDTQGFNSSLMNAGVVVLSNEKVMVDGIEIVGVDYTTGSDVNLLTNTLTSLNKTNSIPKILIKHIPNFLTEVEKYNFDLVLSGHVHNGQVWPGAIFAKMIFHQFSYGYNYLNNMAVVTSSGVGTWGPPQRLGTQSEIVLINLEKK